MISIDNKQIKYFKMYKWSYYDTELKQVITKRYNKIQFYSIGYSQYNRAYERMSIISPDIIPSLTRSQIDAHIKQLLDIIGHDAQTLFNYSLEQYFFTLFAGELQWQILN